MKYILQSLCWKKKKQSHFEPLFLDFDMKISDRKIKFGLFHKRVSFLFSIVWMPYLSSNMLSKIFHSSRRAEIHRIDRTTTGFKNFKSSCHTLISRQVNQGAKLKYIEKFLGKVFSKNFDSFVLLVHVETLYISFFNEMHLDQLFIYTFLHEITCISKWQIIGPVHLKDIVLFTDSDADTSFECWIHISNLIPLLVLKSKALG